MQRLELEFGDSSSSSLSRNDRLSQAVIARDNAITAKNNAIAARNVAIAARNEAVAARDAILLILAERQETILNTPRPIDRRDLAQVIAEQVQHESAVDNYTEAIHENHSAVTAYTEAITASNETISVSERYILETNKKREYESQLQLETMRRRQERWNKSFESTFKTFEAVVNARLDSLERERRNDFHSRVSERVVSDTRPPRAPRQYKDDGAE